MRRAFVPCAMWLLGLSSVVASGAEGPAGLSGAVGGAIGGGAGVGASRGGLLPEAAQIHNRAGIQVQGRADVGGGRAVGPNFNAARLGADARLGVSAGRSGVRANGSGTAKSHAESRRPSERNEPARPAAEEQQNSSRPQDPRVQAAMRADLSLANRLAEIDRLRDIALANGDAHMLVRADALEREARFQHQHQVRQAGVGLSISASERARVRGEEASEFGRTTSERARQRDDEASEYGRATSERARQRSRDEAEAARFEIEAGTEVDAEIQGSTADRAEENTPSSRRPRDESAPRGNRERRAAERSRYDLPARTNRADVEGEAEFNFETRGRTGERDAEYRDAERGEVRPVVWEEELQADFTAEAAAEVSNRPPSREPKRPANRPTSSRRTERRDRLND